MMDKTQAIMLRDRIADALEQLSRETGLEVKLGNCKYSSTSATYQLTLAEVKAGLVMDREALAFKVYASLYGLKAGDLGRTFLYNGVRYRITGLKRQSRKFPIFAESEGGHRMKFTAATIQQYLAREEQPV